MDFDATAKAALGESTLHPPMIGWLDFVGDPVRVTTAPYPVTFAGTGDSDLDGYTFSAADSQFIDVSPVQHREDGSETVTATLSGLITLDSDLLNLIGNPANWRGCDARLWMMIYDANLARVGAVASYYTGRMSSVRISGSPQEQIITVSIESYLANFSQASNRTYLDQASFDPGDLSAEAAIAIANGTEGVGLLNKRTIDIDWLRDALRPF